MEISFDLTSDIRPLENRHGSCKNIYWRQCHFLKLTCDIGDPPVKGPKTHTGEGHKGLILGQAGWYLLLVLPDLK